MTRGRAIAAIAAAFIVSQILAVAVHGFLLAADYAPFDGTLLRAGADGTPPWQMLFLPLVHLSGIVTLVWVYGRLRLTGSTWARGLVLGLVWYGLGELPLWLRWFAEQPRRSVQRWSDAFTALPRGGCLT